MTPLLSVLLCLDDSTSLVAGVRRYAPEPDAGFENERYEVETLTLIVEWEETSAKFPASKARSRKIELLSEDFDGFHHAYKQRLWDEAAMEWDNRKVPVMDEDNGGRA